MSQLLKFIKRKKLNRKYKIVEKKNQKKLLEKLRNLQNKRSCLLNFYDTDVNDIFIKYGENLEFLTESQLITQIIFVRCKFNDFSAHKLPYYLRKNSGVTRIVLQWNEIGDNTANNFGVLLKCKKTKLEELNLDFNKIGRAGAEVIGEGLMINKTLKYLNLGFNRFELDENSSIFKALRFNKTLKRLCLQSITVTSLGADLLIDSLKTNYTLTGLLIDNHLLNPKQIQTIDNLIERNKNLPQRKKEFIIYLHCLKNRLPLELVIMIYNHLIDIHLPI